MLQLFLTSINFVLRLQHSNGIRRDLDKLIAKDILHGSLKCQLLGRSQLDRVVLRSCADVCQMLLPTDVHLEVTFVCVHPDDLVLVHVIARLREEIAPARSLFQPVRGGDALLTREQTAPFAAAEIADVVLVPREGGRHNDLSTRQVEKLRLDADERTRCNFVLQRDHTVAPRRAHVQHRALSIVERVDDRSHVLLGHRDVH
mmetsp:Transcript_9679/g.21608  ORF Transcript_9679/g.21608 Transcript_9679/m.21608 type:complete len:202 (-) Transcript_9679:420-1025(-)